MQPSEATPTILVVDDDPVFRSLTRDALEGAGLDNLLLRIRQVLANGGLSVSDTGELRLGSAQASPSAAQRLALHRAIAEAAASAGH